MKKNKKLKLKRNVKLYFLLFISITILIFSTIKIFSWLNDTPKTQEIIKEIEEVTEVTEYESNEAEIIETEEEPESPYWSYIKMKLIDVDFNELKSINDETVAWLNVGGTSVNYPVVKHSDNDFYLTHSFDKSKNKAGWVFMDYRNNNEIYDKNTIIYAHNRKDKAMFGSLKGTLNDNWYNNTSNHIIKMSSETSNTLWQIFSVYTIETTNDYIRTIFSSDNDFEEFINLIKNRSVYSFNTNVTSTDKLLTLSTCHGNTKKLVIHAKLIKQEIKN